MFNDIRIQYQKFRILFLLLIATIGLSAGVNAQNAWINELHYDDNNISPPGDMNEVVEIVIENPSDYTLSLFSVDLYNGHSNSLASYNTKTLDLFTVGYTIGNFTIYYYIYPNNTVQNGSPDGLALAYNGTVISGQFLSYEGTFTAISGVAAGLTSVDIGVAENNNTPVGFSLQLSGTGTQYSDFAWQDPVTATAGTLNTGQTLVSVAVPNPANFNAVASSTSQIELSWNNNNNSDDVMVAWNIVNSFGTPSGTYPIDEIILGGGTVIYKGQEENYSHTGRNPETTYYYKAWSVDGSNTYSAGVTDNATTQFAEPSEHPEDFAASSNGFSSINVSWVDSDADHYLVKGSSIDYGSIVPPVDLVGESNGLLVKNVNASVQSEVFTGLTASTTYYFEIFPYNGTGLSSDYKTDGDVPQTSASTSEFAIDLIITEVTNPKDLLNANAKFVEIMNAGTSTIDFSTITVYFSKQSNGGSTWGDIQLTGILGPGETYVIGNNNTSFFNSYGFGADLYSSNVVDGNGNDCYFLYYGGNHTAGTLLDAYGVKDENGTGKGWDYTDKKAVRKRNISNPNITWTASEWVILPVPAYVKDLTPGYHKGTVTWQGTTSTNWNEKGTNWNSPNGFIPDASCNVTVPYTGITNFPIVTEASACHELELLNDGLNGASLSVQSTGSLLIVGP